jgi:hypothetical protein
MRTRLPYARMKIDVVGDKSRTGLQARSDNAGTAKNGPGDPFYIE